MRPTLSLLALTLLAGSCTPLQEGADPHVPRANRNDAALPPFTAPGEPVAVPRDAAAPDLLTAGTDASAATDTGVLPTDAPYVSPCPAASAGNYGQPCGSCGGTVSCSGACTVPTPEDHGQISVSDVETFERTGARSSRGGEWIGGDCTDGHVGGGCSAEATRTGSGGPDSADCIVTRESRRCRCRVRWWADPGVTLHCTVTILARRVCDR
jgi:hypothetical protein